MRERKREGRRGKNDEQGEEGARTNVGKLNQRKRQKPTETKTIFTNAKFHFNFTIYSITIFNKLDFVVVTVTHTE